MIAPQIGDLRETISIISVTDPYNDNGEGTYVETIATVRASVEPIGGDLSETEITEQTASQNYRIWIRYMTGIYAWHQITWGSRRLQLLQPPEDLENRHRWMLLNAVERISRSV